MATISADMAEANRFPGGKLKALDTAAKLMDPPMYEAANAATTCAPMLLHTEIPHVGVLHQIGHPWETCPSLDHITPSNRSGQDTACTAAASGINMRQSRCHFGIFLQAAIHTECAS